MIQIATTKIPILVGFSFMYFLIFSIIDIWIGLSQFLFVGAYGFRGCSYSAFLDLFRFSLGSNIYFPAGKLGG